MKSEPAVTERQLTEAIREAGSPEKAAPILGVSRRTVYRWMKHYALRRVSVIEREAA